MGRETHLRLATQEGPRRGGRRPSPIPTKRHTRTSTIPGSVSPPSSLSFPQSHATPAEIPTQIPVSPRSPLFSLLVNPRPAVSPPVFARALSCPRCPPRQPTALRAKTLAAASRSRFHREAVEGGPRCRRWSLRGRARSGAPSPSPRYVPMAPR